MVIQSCTIRSPRILVRLDLTPLNQSHPLRHQELHCSNPLIVLTYTFPEKPQTLWDLPQVSPPVLESFQDCPLTPHSVTLFHRLFLFPSPC